MAGYVDQYLATERELGSVKSSVQFYALWGVIAAANSVRGIVSFNPEGDTLEQIAYYMSAISLVSFPVNFGLLGLSMKRVSSLKKKLSEYARDL